MTTDVEIDATKTYFESKALGGWSGTVSVDASYLYVDYTSAGQIFVVDLSLPVTLDMTETFITDYVLVLSSQPSISITTLDQTAFNVLLSVQPATLLSTILTTDYNIVMSWSPTVSLVLDAVKALGGGVAYVVDLALGLTTSLGLDIWPSVLAPTETWQTYVVIALAVTCLVVGLVLGEHGN